MGRDASADVVRACSEEEEKRWPWSASLCFGVQQSVGCCVIPSGLLYSEMYTFFFFSQATLKRFTVYLYYKGIFLGEENVLKL